MHRDQTTFYKRYTTYLFPLFFSLFMGLAWLSCQPPPQPLAEAVFRLQTNQKPTGCSDALKDLPCRWDVRGKIDSLDVVGQSENPFSDCQACRFNQRIGVVDELNQRHDLYYRLPTEDAVPLTIGKDINFSYIDGQTVGRGYALLMRNQEDDLLFAVTQGAGGGLLTAESFSPFEVSLNREQEVGTQIDNCGTQVFRPLEIKTDAGAQNLIPGEIKDIVSPQGTRYRVANINMYNWRATSCSELPEPPYAFFLFRLAGR
ncbi:MAG: hypothetical protein AAGJ35_00705 [Myxococcota bacterium]